MDQEADDEMTPLLKVDKHGCLNTPDASKKRGKHRKKK